MGMGGSGKSTLARALGQRLGLPVVHLDRVYWQPGWVELGRDQFTAEQERLTRQDQWIIDGNYSATLALRLERADTLIYLDLPTWLCLWRILRRAWRYRGRTRPDMTPGNRERLSLNFLWLVATHKYRSRPRVMKKFAQLAPHQHLVILKSTRQVKAFLNRV